MTVIVVTHNGRDKARMTLRSLREHMGGATAELIVVDAGSTDGTPDTIEIEFPEARVIRRQNVGFAAGNNVGLKLARGRYVLLLNPDVEFVVGDLERLVRALDARPNVGAASVIQQSPDTTLQPSVRRFPSPLRQFGEALGFAHIPGLQRLQEHETDASAYESEHSADWLVGAFLMVRRAAIEEVGLLDQRFFLYSEETDWCYRFRAAGWDVRHFPFARVMHHVGGYPSPALAAQLTYSKLLFARKHLPAASRTGVRAGLILRHALRLATRAPLATLPRHGPAALAEAQCLAVALGCSRLRLRLARLSHRTPNRS